ncbi:hypothetical protein SLEP1_g30711 [Rubroshorea leprosula]|uniref:Secreted protein n=1 Tax=Rubroshorea leprosula TaxID=152421 RepID=A0AAV5K8F4_9ROSI|nr:hypothetical protein SLEP1_g30711 [Rubroshorea leprosula]
MGFGLLWHLHVFGVLRQAPWSWRLYFFRQVCYHGLLVSMEVKQGDQAVFAAVAHEGDEVVPGGWNGSGGWRGSNESNRNNGVKPLTRGISNRKTSTIDGR